eukprot:Hpha_TRINITY_DN2059_c0_g1::TRINITY_DN2059_c0_g1_i1::g.83073::m.83073
MCNGGSAAADSVPLVQRVGCCSLSPEDKACLEECAEGYRARRGGLEGSAYHAMIWGRGVDDDKGGGGDDRVAGLARRLAAELCPGSEVISIRMLFSEDGCPPQPWHIDYARDFADVRTILLGVTRSTASNCTEVLAFPDASSAAAVCRLAREQDRPLAKAEWERYNPSLQPLLLEGWDAVVVRTSHIFHRRGGNRSGFARITLNVDCVPGECADIAQFQCLDTQRNRESGRICPREQVDNLGEQDCFLLDK